MGLQKAWEPKVQKFQLWLLELNVNSPNFFIFSQGKSYLRNASKFGKFSSVQVTVENNHFHLFLNFTVKRKDSMLKNIWVFEPNWNGFEYRLCYNLVYPRELLNPMSSLFSIYKLWKQLPLSKSCWKNYMIYCIKHSTQFLEHSRCSKCQYPFHPINRIYNKFQQIAWVREVKA